MKKIFNFIVLFVLFFIFYTVRAESGQNSTDVVVTITGKQNSAPFDGLRHAVNGYDVSISNENYTEEDFIFSGTAAAVRNTVGISYMGLDTSQFINKNPKYKVTFEVTDGYQEIISLDEVIVTITGHEALSVFDGNEHKVSGYDVKISTPAYTESDFIFYGRAEAKRTNVGKSCMGLREEDFSDLSGKFKKVTFVITDGCQVIVPAASTPVNIIIYNIQEKGKEGIPYDIESYNIPLMAVIKNDTEEFVSETLNIDSHLLLREPKMKFTLTFKEILPDLTTGQYSVDIYGLPEYMNGTEYIEGSDQAEKNKYMITFEAWINEYGTIDLTVLWTAKKYYEITEDNGLPEDAVGSYIINDDGEREYVVFHSYAICMNYLGNDELCSDPGRTYQK